MRCPRCGNEVSRDEVFCGQCGASITSQPPAPPTEMVNTPPPRSGLLSSYNTRLAPPSSPYNPGTMPQAPGGGTPPPPQPTAPGQSQPQFRQSGPQQQANFYQDATEAISALPPGSNQAYPQQSFPGASIPGGYPGAGTYYGQPAQPGSYAVTGYPQPQTQPAGQGFGYGYGTPGNIAPPPEQKRNHVVLIVACVCLAVALIIATVFGVFFLQHNQANQANNATPQLSPTSVPTATSTPIPSPTPTSTPTPVPTPTTPPTPTPDPGFAFCDQTCTTNGFSVEYPSSWQQGTTNDGTGVQFTNPSAQNQYAAFKVAGSTSATANQLVDTDLQNNFASKSGYSPPTSSQSTTIGGVTWVYSTATYDLSGQTERIQVYATVRQGKSYIIELEAADSNFDTINTKYFETTLGSFQFQ